MHTCAQNIYSALYSLLSSLLVHALQEGSSGKTSASPDRLEHVASRLGIRMLRAEDTRTYIEDIADVYFRFVLPARDGQEQAPELLTILIRTMP